MSSAARATLQTLAARWPWLRDHDPALAEELVGKATIARRGAGEWIYAEGDPATGLVIVLEGLVQFHCGATDGISCMIGQAGPGAILGQAVRLGGGPRLHTLICAVDSVVAKVPDTAISEIAARRPEMWRFVVNVLYVQLEGVLQLLTQTIALPPRRRLAARLCMLAGRRGRVPFTQAALAETLGLTRKTVNLHLGEFERAGLVRRAYGRIEVLDRPALRKMAEAEEAGRQA